MTTDSDITTVESVAEETPTPRSIDEIARVVKRSGYSLLSDEEVERYVEYRSKVAVERAEIEAQTKAAQEAHDLYRQQAREAYERAETAFRQACETRAEFAAVSDEQA